MTQIRPTRDMVEQWWYKTGALPGECLGFTDAEYLAEQSFAAGMKEAARIEPVIPSEIKGRVQAEWFWKGVLAAQAAIRAAIPKEKE